VARAVARQFSTAVQLLAASSRLVPLRTVVNFLSMRRRGHTLTTGRKSIAMNWRAMDTNPSHPHLLRMVDAVARGLVRQFRTSVQLLAASSRLVPLRTVVNILSMRRRGHTLTTGRKSIAMNWRAMDTNPRPIDHHHLLRMVDAVARGMARQFSTSVQLLANSSRLVPLRTVVNILSMRRRGHTLTTGRKSIAMNWRATTDLNPRPIDHHHLLRMVDAVARVLVRQFGTPVHLLATASSLVPLLTVVNILSMRRRGHTLTTGRKSIAMNCP
jgi:hypothetical protein